MLAMRPSVGERSREDATHQKDTIGFDGWILLYESRQSLISSSFVESHRGESGMVFADFRRLLVEP
jgi:hypothetical protein